MFIILIMVELMFKALLATCFLLLGSINSSHAKVIIGVSGGMGVSGGEESAPDSGDKSRGGLLYGMGLLIGQSFYQEQLRLYYGYDTFSGVTSAWSGSKSSGIDAFEMQTHNIHADYYFRAPVSSFTSLMTISLGEPFVGVNVGYGKSETEFKFGDASDVVKLDGGMFGFKVGSAFILGSAHLQAGFRYNWLINHKIESEFGSLKWNGIGQAFANITLNF
ncbi:hypothetical protein [Vibrio cidicii]|uniref:hypothetical protein n=1 Tax=Vibrio cidicii TaxID=1763883 RepID=UPI0007800431|nr:hypothetical protein [Vibrio cidicii]KYN87475.1 hypothetical protein ATY36_03690 [Vibrio cidicii]